MFFERQSLPLQNLSLALCDFIIGLLAHTPTRSKRWKAILCMKMKMKSVFHFGAFIFRRLLLVSTQAFEEPYTKWIIKIFFWNKRFIRKQRGCNIYKNDGNQTARLFSRSLQDDSKKSCSIRASSIPFRGLLRYYKIRKDISETITQISQIVFLCSFHAFLL